MPDPSEAGSAVFEDIEGWYNPHRRNAAIGYHSPIAYERQHEKAAAMRKPEPVH